MPLHVDMKGAGADARATGASAFAAMLAPADMKFGLCTVYAASQNVYDHAVPFGGYKDSGIGRDKGEYALHHYTQVGRAREEGVAAGIASRLPHDVRGVAQHPCLSHLTRRWALLLTSAHSADSLGAVNATRRAAQGRALMFRHTECVL